MGTAHASRLDKCGPCWVYCPNPLEAPNPTVALDSDYRSVLMKQWQDLQKEKGWVLRDEWREEAADFRSPDDERLEEEERKFKTADSDDEVSVHST